MRATSYCTNHPSKEAGLRCRSCGKWLCDRCTRVFHGRVFCGHRCRAHDLAARHVSKIAGAARSQVPILWTAIIVGLGIVFTGTWIIVLVLRLQTVNDHIDVRREPLPYAVAELVRHDDTLRVVIQGSPDATVLLIADGVPARILTLDGKGRAVLTDAGFAEGVSLEIAALAEPPESVPGLPTLTPTRTAVPEVTGTPTPTRTPSPDATRPPVTPTRTPTQTRGTTRQAAPSRRRVPTEPAEQYPSTETSCGGPSLPKASGS
jgi:hypothetical protein